MLSLVEQDILQKYFYKNACFEMKDITDERAIIWNARYVRCIHRIQA